MGTLLSKANNSKTGSKTSKSTVHIYYDALIEEGLTESLKSKIKVYFYLSKWNELIGDDNIKAIIRNIQSIAESGYVSRGNESGLMLLGYTNNEARKLIEAYKLEIKGLYQGIIETYQKEIKASEIGNKGWFSSIEVDEEGTYYKIDGKPFIDDVIKAKTGNKTYIRGKDFVYTYKFNLFLTGNTDKLNKTDLRSVKAYLNYRKKEWKQDLASKLCMIVGTRKAKRLVGMGESVEIEKMGKTHHSSYYYITKTNGAKIPLLPHVVDYLGVSKNTKSKLRKEIKKAFYQMYKEDIKEVYVNATLDEEVDEALLLKYHILANEVSEVLIQADIITLRKRDEVMKGWRDEDDVEDLIILNTR